LKKNNKISIKTEGELSELKMILYDEEIEYKNLQDIELFFNIKHVQLFSKGYNLNKKTKIRIGHNIPIEFSYNIFDGYIKYYLAPKLPDN